MRFRSAALMSAALIASLALAGCSGGDEETGDAGADEKDALCSAAGASGDVVDSLDIPGTADDGAPEKVDVGDGVDPAEFQRSVATEGDGNPLAEGDYAFYASATYSIATGEQVNAAGYDEQGLPPQQISSTAPTAAIFGCATVGSRIVTAYPASTDDQGNQVDGMVQIVDVLRTPPKKAWGEDVSPEAGMPTVELADNGDPTVAIPDGLKVAKTTKVEVLKQGDGAEVTKDGAAYVQYKGVKASDGEQFDASWNDDGGAVVEFPISNVVPGFQKALIGQRVGSQVVAVIPKEEAYHNEQSKDSDLYDEDLVFVVDILDAYTPPAAPAE